MDKIVKYREIIKSILTHYYEFDKEQPSPGVEPFIAFDEARDHYFWLQVGNDYVEQVLGFAWIVPPLASRLRIL